jgi:hypothetical protein
MRQRFKGLPMILMRRPRRTVIVTQAYHSLAEELSGPQVLDPRAYPVSIPSFFDFTSPSALKRRTIDDVALICCLLLLSSCCSSGMIYITSGLMLLSASYVRYCTAQCFLLGRSNARIYLYVSVSHRLMSPLKMCSYSPKLE